MQFTDSHIHLQDYKLNNAQQIVTEMKNFGFVKIVCVSARPNEWNKVALLAEEYYDFIVPAFGLHPWYVTEVNENWEKELADYLQKFPNAWVGECGLDRLKAPSEDNQLLIFQKQIELAKKFNRPMNIHALRADELFNNLWQEMPKRFIMHSFGGSVEFMKQVLKFGGYISLSASVLKRKNYVDIIKNLPLEHLLLESDFPYLSNYNQIFDLTNTIAQIKKISQEDVVLSVYCNFEELCNDK